jgi:hypothetical protein
VSGFEPNGANERSAERAMRDLENRTLAHLNGDLSKVVYLSATRDYNTGEYRHQGLEQRFGSAAAQFALARCHQAAFQNLLECGLGSLVGQLADYIDSTGAGKEQVLESWRQLEAYRVLIPGTCDSLSGDFFISNIKIALEILRADMTAGHGNSPTLQLQRLPGLQSPLR